MRISLVAVLAGFVGDWCLRADGSIEVYFGPTAPKGVENNWIPTVPGRAWLAYLRFYAPTEADFDQSWPLPDIEKVK
jgi:hypothetical protein